MQRVVSFLRAAIVCIKIRILASKCNFLPLSNLREVILVSKSYDIVLSSLLHLNIQGLAVGGRILSLRLFGVEKV